MITLIVILYSWIDKYANLNTFIGLIVGIIGLIISVHLYKKQTNNTKQKKETDAYTETEESYLGVSIKIDHTSRRFIGYGLSNGEIIQSGSYKANYEVEIELSIIIQNESLNTVYNMAVTYTPNNYSKRYTLIDSRDNKLQPLEGNKHFKFILRITNVYYDMYAQDVDEDIKKIYKLGKDISLLNGSKIIIKYQDFKHREHSKTEIIT